MENAWEWAGHCYPQLKIFNTLPSRLPLAVQLFSLPSLTFSQGFFPSRCQAGRMVQATVLWLRQPFSESLDEAPVNKTERLYRSFSRAVIGCAVVLLSLHVCPLFVLMCTDKYRGWTGMLTEGLRLHVKAFITGKTLCWEVVALVRPYHGYHLQRYIKMYVCKHACKWIKTIWGHLWKVFSSFSSWLLRVRVSTLICTHVKIQIMVLVYPFLYTVYGVFTWWKCFLLELAWWISAWVIWDVAEKKHWEL